MQEPGIRSGETTGMHRTLPALLLVLAACGHSSPQPSRADKADLSARHACEILKINPPLRNQLDLAVNDAASAAKYAGRWQPLYDALKAFDGWEKDKAAAQARAASETTQMGLAGALTRTVVPSGPNPNGEAVHDECAKALAP